VQTLGAKPGFFAKLVPVVVERFGNFYPELAAKQDAVIGIISEEEQSFAVLLENGVKFFNEIVNEVKASGSKTIPGDRAFYLYDSLGFPVDLTQLMASELGLSVDLDSFATSMREQKERSRANTKAKQLVGLNSLALAAEQTSYLQKAGISPTDDSDKYVWDSPVETVVKALFTPEGFKDRINIDELQSSNTVGIILEKSPFYAEAGGQVSDTGKLEFLGGPELDVVDVQVSQSLPDRMKSIYSFSH
jgi:alanyl-tRNA synthetase